MKLGETEVETREVKLAKITWDIWHEVELRRRFLNFPVEDDRVYAPGRVALCPDDLR